MASWWLVIATLLLSCSRVLESQKVHIQPPLAYAVAGGNVFLSCYHSLGSNSTVNWQKGSIRENLELTDSTILFSGTSMVITQFNASRHAGYYTCSVQGLLRETVISCPAEVILAYADFGNVKSPEDTIAATGSSVVFHCNVQHSVPRVQVSWTHNSLPIESMTDIRITVMPSGNLFISSVDTSSSGSYQCIATNPVTLISWKSDEAMLSIIGTENSTVPTFVVEPEDTEAIEGSTVVLECAGQGNPKPTVKWEKVDTDSSSRSLPERASVHFSGALIVSNVSRIHSGTYACKLLSGDLELQQTRVNLTITGIPQFKQAFTFADGDGRSGLACTSRVNSLSEGDCQQDLYVLYNGTIINQTKGDTSAYIVHYFNFFPEVNATQVYQCISISPGGCTVEDVQANFVNGIIIDNTIVDSPFDGSDISSLCEASTPTKDTITAPSTELSGETTLMSEATSSSCESNSEEPALEVNIQRSTTCSTVGSVATSSCEVVGPGSGSVSVTWLYNGTRDLLAQPVENISVDIQSSKHNSVTRITADLVISWVDYLHAGTYVCSARSVCPSMHASSSITFSIEATKPTVAPPPITTSMAATATESVQTTQTEEVLPITAITETDSPPSSTPPSRPFDKPTQLHGVFTSITSKDVHLTWTYPDINSISGFKINWDIASRVTKSARHAVEANRLRFVISSSSYDSSSELVIYVWAYNVQGDGPYSSLRINPVIETTTGPSTTATTTTVVHPTINTILQCSATSISATTLELSWPSLLRFGSPSLILISVCEEGNTMDTTSIQSSDSPYVISRALPNCSYTFEIQSTRHIAVCRTTTPAGQVDIEVNVTRLSNGSAAIHLCLPPEIHDEEDLLVEVNWGTGWLTLEEFHIPAHFDSSKDHQIEIRLQLGRWKGYANVTVPAILGEEEEQEGGRNTIDAVLTYIVIFGTLLVTCAILLAVILGLKYLQWSHREQDKVTDFREKSRQYFPDPERDEKSSLKSQSSDNSTAV